VTAIRNRQGAGVLRGLRRLAWQEAMFGRVLPGMIREVPRGSEGGSEAMAA